MLERITKHINPFMIVRKPLLCSPLSTRSVFHRQFTVSFQAIATAQILLIIGYGVLTFHQVRIFLFLIKLVESLAEAISIGRATVTNR